MTPRNMADAETNPRKGKTILFRLYIANEAPSSAQAMANLPSICQEYLPGRHEIEVVDILREPLRALAEGILVTPTLVRLSPPVRHIVGDLSDRAIVLRALGLEGKAKMSKRRSGVDTTKRTDTEQAQRRTDELFRALIENASDVITILDAEGIIRYASPSVERVLGYKPHELIGTDIAELLHPADLSKLLESYAAMKAGVRSGTPEICQITEERLRHKDGSWRILEGIAKVLDTPSVAGIVINSRDITARKRVERELQEKSASLERFTYAISHDLKSPLVTVKTFLGYLEQDLLSSNTGRIEKDVFYMRTAADKMGQLLDELLKILRVGRVANPPVRVTFRELVEEALNVVAGSIAGREVKVQVNDAPITLYGDRPRLVEIWQNLVENAVKFMGDQASPRIEIGAERRGGDTVFFVRDNGIGIDPRHQAKVFDLFGKIGAKSEGEGLGLALIKRIVELYRGTIWLESKGLGQGACFLFTLPGAVKNQEEREKS